MLLRELNPRLVEMAMQAVRQFFYKQNFLEVRVPLLNEALPLESNLYSFNTFWSYQNKQKQFYLPTSPEAALKKALAAGERRVFALSPSFRNQDPSDSDHHPEFLMLEWYRSDCDYHKIMNDLEQLILFLVNKLHDWSIDHYAPVITTPSWLISSEWPRVSLLKLFKQATGESLNEVLTDPQMVRLAEGLGYQTADANWAELFDQIMADKIEPMLGLAPIFIEDLPAKLSPLCCLNQSAPYLAERFELYLGRAEIANGNNEQTDSLVVNYAFEQEKSKRQVAHLPLHPLDADFLEALAMMHQSGQKFAGVGLGLERLLKVLVGA